MATPIKMNGFTVASKPAASAISFSAPTAAPCSKLYAPPPLGTTFHFSGPTKGPNESDKAYMKRYRQWSDKMKSV